VSSIPTSEPVIERAAEHEQVVVAHDRASGLRAIVAIHSTVLGPALGGTRMYPYPDLSAALADALDLSAAMTAKNSLAGLPHGGGKAVIIGDPGVDKSPELLRAYGRLVASLGGRYVTAADVGTYVADMDVIATVNPWTTGRSPEHGGAGDSGVLTALGLHAAMRACAEHRWGTPSLAGRRVGIEGVGKVGSRLAGHVLEDGGEVMVCDVDQAALDRLTATHPQVQVIARADLLRAELDVLAPCALGGTLTAAVVDRLQAQIVCGGANNQLGPDAGAALLAGKGVLYAPEFVANAGGVIAVADELGGYDPARATRATGQIGQTMARVLQRADEDSTTPWDAAVRLAQERIDVVADTVPAFRGFPPPTPPPAP
jgi:valine dehydrogenase (NAD+)